ncbi:polyprenyl diphosphate synthase [Streptomyces sp. NPDC005574]|uniref:polyprenyl diphosphate synthase n=1 Tax=Streptomyces sp. NPDC005574 TaxID=3156891 RepID=UPI00339FA38F
MNHPVIGNDPALRAAYRLCRRQTREQDPAEYAMIRLLPAVLRPACWALWAAANAIDDLADNRATAPGERAARIEAWISALDDDVAHGTSRDPVRHALIDTAARWHLDLSDLREAMTLVRDDTEGRHFPDWAAWRAWGRGNLLPWFDQVRTLLDRAGLPLPLRADQHDSYQQFLDGFRLTDLLTDLGADLAHGDLLLPHEVLAHFPGAEAHLLQRHWSPAVADLVADLSARARRWLTQPDLTRGMHPGPATVLHTMTGLLTAQLDAVDAAGPTLLHTAPHLSHLAHARVLAPAHLRAALAWSLTPIALPPTRRSPVAGASLSTPRERVPDSAVFRAPPPHPSGIRPPLIPSDRMPAHVAVIMDGNRRWAQQRGLPTHEGHRAGLRAMRETVYGALEIGLRHLTVYTFSTENWRRETGEVEAILALLRGELDEDPYRELDVRLRWSGRPDRLPAALADALRRQEATTRTRTGLTLTVCIDYGGRNEITRAAAALARAARTGDLDPDHITEEDLTLHLPRPHLPDVDLLWRPGGEQRTSNFLPWQATYAELHFTPQWWPDTDRRDLWQAIAEHGRRQRRHGAAPTPFHPGNTPENSDKTQLVPSGVTPRRPRTAAEQMGHTGGTGSGQASSHTDTELRRRPSDTS